MNLQNIEDIKSGLKSGEFFLSDGKLYAKDDWGKILDAKQQEAHYDLLQLTKKIQL